MDSFWTEEYRRYRPIVFRVARRVLCDDALADEAVQEAFLDHWQNPHRYDPARASLSTRLCLLAHRRAVDIARREARRRVHGDVREPLDPSSYTAEEEVLLRYEQRRVRDAVERLTPLQREVVELAF